MATETELERLVVRFVGDVKDYVDKVATTVTVTKSAAKDIESAASKMAADLVANAKAVEQAYAASAKSAVGASAKSAAVIKNVIIATEQYAKEVARLDGLLSKGLITQNTYNEAINVAKFRLDEAAGAASRLERVTESLGFKLESIGRGAKLLGSQIEGAFLGILTTALQTAAAFERTSIAFEVLIGTAAEAGSTLNQFTKFAAETPFKLAEVEKAGRGLILFGDTANEAQKDLITLGNASAATGSQLDEVVLIFNQIRGAGQLLGQDFRQLAQRGVLSSKDLARYMKVAEKDILSLREAGKISFEDVRGALELASKEGGRFANAMERDAKSMGGLWNTLTDSLTILLRKIGEELVPIIKPVLSFLIMLTKEFDNLPKAVKLAIAAIMVLGVATGALLIAAGTAIIIYKLLGIQLIAYVGGLTLSATATSALSVATAILNSSLTLLLLKVGAFAAIAYGIYGVTKELTGTADATRQFDAELKKSGELAKQWGDNFTQATNDIKANIDSITLPEMKEGFIVKELERANIELEGMVRNIKGQEKLLNEMQNTGWKRLVGASDIELLDKQIEQLGKDASLGRDRVAMLERELAKIKRPDKDLGLIKDINEFVDKLREQRDTFGKTSDQVDIYKFRMRGATEQMLAAAQAGALLNNRLKDFNTLVGESFKFQQDIADQINFVGLDEDTIRLKKLQRELDELKTKEAFFQKELARLVNPEDVKAAKEVEQAIEKIKQDSLILKTTIDLLPTLINAKKADEEFKKLKEDAKSLTKEMMTPLEKYNEGITRLVRMAKAQLIDKQTFTRGVQDLTKKYDDATDSIRKARQELEKFDAALIYSAEGQYRIDKFKEMLREQLDNRNRLTKPDFPPPPIPLAPFPRVPKFDWKGKFMVNPDGTAVPLIRDPNNLFPANGLNGNVSDRVAMQVPTVNNGGIQDKTAVDILKNIDDKLGNIQKTPGALLGKANLEG